MKNITTQSKDAEVIQTKVIPQKPDINFLKRRFDILLNYTNWLDSRPSCLPYETVQGWILDGLLPIDKQVTLEMINAAYTDVMTATEPMIKHVVHCDEYGVNPANGQRQYVITRIDHR